MMWIDLIEVLLETLPDFLLRKQLRFSVNRCNYIVVDSVSEFQITPSIDTGCCRLRKVIKIFMLGDNINDRSVVTDYITVKSPLISQYHGEKFVICTGWNAIYAEKKQQQTFCLL